MFCYSFGISLKSWNFPLKFLEGHSHMPNTAFFLNLALSKNKTLLHWNIRIEVHWTSLTWNPIRRDRRPLNPSFTTLVYGRNTPLLVFVGAPTSKCDRNSIHYFGILEGRRSCKVFVLFCAKCLCCLSIFIRLTSYHRASSYLINLRARSCPLIVLDQKCFICSPDVLEWTPGLFV